MKRSKLYFNTSGYLVCTIGMVLFFIILSIFTYIFFEDNKILVMGVLAIVNSIWVIDWIRKYKYLGDIIYKRLETKKYKVSMVLPGWIDKRSYVKIIVLNEETGLEETFSYFNDYAEGKIDSESKLESIEFVYLAETKVVVEIIDFQLKESKKKKTIKFKEVTPIETCNKKVIRKVYRDFEKEIDWLNEMSEKGLALCEYTWGRYVFEETLPNEYIFTIEPLMLQTYLRKSIKYIESLQEMNIEFVGGSGIWLYIRKKTFDGPFGKKIEVNSRINHYRKDYPGKRIALIWFWIIIIANVVVGVIFASKLNLILGSIGIPLAIISTLAVLKVKKRINKLLEKDELIE